MGSGFVAWQARVSGCGDLQLVTELQRLARVDRKCEVRMLVYLAEVEARLLHLARGYSSMFTYAKATLRMSEAQTYLRIQAARVAQTYPVVLGMLEEGALNLTTLKLLAPHLTADNHVTLLERARNKSKREVELLVAEIAPLPDVPTRLRKLPSAAARKQSNVTEMRLPSVGPVTSTGPANIATTTEAHSTSVTNVTARSSAGSTEAGGSTSVSQDALRAQATVALDAQERAATGLSTEALFASEAIASKGSQRKSKAFALEAPRASCKPLGPERFKLELTTNQKLHDTLMQLQHLLRHQVPSGDLASIVERALDDLLAKTLKQRFAQRSKPRSFAKGSTSLAADRTRTSERIVARDASNDGDAHATSPETTRPVVAVVESARSGAKLDGPTGARARRRGRYIPRAVVRAVSERDGRQCAFVSSDGQRCSEHGMLELHHVHAFARGGAASVENLKWMCRAHNAFFAVQDFGAAHMRSMRLSAAERGGRNAQRS